MKLIKLASSIALGAALLTGTVACSNNHSDDDAKTTQKSTTKNSSEKSSESSKSSTSEKVTPVEEDTIKLTLRRSN